MSQTDVQTALQAPYKPGGPYPHCCQLCQNLVIDISKLGWFGRLLFRFRWLDTLVPMGITISEVDDASDSCLFFKSIITRNHSQRIPFDKPEEQLYWWLRKSRAGGIFKIDVGPRYLLKEKPAGYPLKPGFPRIFKDEVPYNVFAIKGNIHTLCIREVG